MSKAQKLVNRAIAILQRRLQPDGLNDQKALAEIRALLNRTEDDGTGKASEQVQRAKRVMQQHGENSLSDHQAMNEMHSIFEGIGSKIEKQL
jgi:hypothetical protein